MTNQNLLNDVFHENRTDIANADMKNPKVSIVVPVYNMEHSLAASVESLLSQTYHNIEVVLVDDGSKDQSLQCARDLASTDGRVTVVHTENRGSGPARNSGIEASTGQYIYFPDADDVLEPKAIEILVKAISEPKEVDLVVFGYRNINQKGELISEKKYQEREASGNELRHDYSECMGTSTKWGIQGAPWNKFFSLDLIKKNGVRFPSLRRHQDEGFIGRYMCHVQNVRFIIDVLYNYKVNSISQTWRKYPINYLDAVIGLNEVRKETIYTWNPQDTKTRDFLCREYICNAIKSLELAFSPKLKELSISKRQFIRQGVEKSKLADQDLPQGLGSYQRLVLKLIKGDRSLTLLTLFWLKTRVEKLGLR